jgi:hypothetical protein
LHFLIQQPLELLLESRIGLLRAVTKLEKEQAIDQDCG